MARIEVVCWRVNAGRIANESPALRLAKLQAKILRGFSDPGPVDLRLFAVPEFYFFHANKSTDDLRWYTETQLDGVYDGVAALSQLQQNLLVVGGSVCWAKPKGAKFLHQRRWHIHNEAPIAYRGVKVGLCAKRLYGGEHDPGDALRIYRAEQGHFDYTENYITAQDDEAGNPIMGQRQAANIEAIAFHGRARFQNGTVKAPGARTATKKYAARILFRHRNSPKIYNLPGGLSLGVEICQEHNQAILQGCGRVDLHVIVSNTVGRNTANHALNEGGILVHCDAGEIWVGQLQGGQVADINAWNDLGGELYQQVVDTDI